jgi:hypothetical protein
VSSTVLWSRLPTVGVPFPLGSLTVPVQEPQQLLANSHTTTTFWRIILGFPKATRGFEPISYRGALLSTLLHAPVYMFLLNLLNVLVQIPNKMGLQKKNLGWFTQCHSRSLSHHNSLLQSQRQVMLRPAVSRSVSLGVRHPLGSMTILWGALSEERTGL